MYRNTSFTLTRFKQRLSAVPQTFLSAEGCAVVLRKVAESLRFTCGHYGSFAVFAVHTAVGFLEQHITCENTWYKLYIAHLSRVFVGGDEVIVGDVDEIET